MMGRITQGMMNTQFLRNLNHNLSNMNKYQEQMSTTRKINRPSDDPVGLSYTMRYRSDLTANDQYQENVDSATSWLDFTDSMLNQANSALQRIRELSVNGANGSNPPSALEAIKAEILQLTDQLVTIGNSQFNGKYVFNGQLTDVAPYSKAMNQNPPSISVQGAIDVSTANVTKNNNVLTLKIDGGKEVTVTLPPKDYSVGGATEFAADLQSAINAASPNASVQVTANADNQLVISSNNAGASGSIEITGGSLAVGWLSQSRDLSDIVKTPNPLATNKIYDFSAKRSNTDGGDILFEIATGVTIPVNISGDTVFGKPGESDNLFQVLNDIVNALDVQDTSTVSSLLGKLDTRMNTFLAARADLGAKMSRVELSDERLKDININLKTLQSKTEDADMAETITILKTYESVYNASLSVGSRVLSPSLVDFLK